MGSESILQSLDLRCYRRSRCLLIFVLLALPLSATTYYVDNCVVSGSDSNDGASMSTPWRTISKVNNSSFSPGDSVLFNAGCTWREQLTVPSSGSSGSPLTFGAYGSGKAPQIFGSDTANTEGSWTQESATLWYTSASTAPNIVWRDGFRMTKLATKGALVSDGQWWYDSGGQKVYVYSSANPASAHTFEIPQRATSIIGTDKDYLRFQNLDLRYTNDALIRATRSSGRVNNWEVTECNAQGSWHRGIEIGYGASAINQADNAYIHNNTLSDIGGDTASDYREISLRYGDSGKINNNTLAIGDLPENNYRYGIVYEHTSATGGSPTPEISGNTLTGTISVNTGDAGGMIAASGIHYCTIADNKIWVDGIGIHFDEAGLATGDGPANCNITRNWIKQTGAVPAFGILIENSPSNTITYNVVDAQNATNYHKAVWIRNGAGGNSNGTVVYNNSVVIPAGANGIQLGWASDDSAAANNTVKNNIIYASAPGAGLVIVDSPSHAGAPNGNLLDYNLYFGNSPTWDVGWYGAFYSTPAAFNSAVSTQEGHAVNGNPMFTNAGTGDLTLQSTSPAINVGVDLGTTYNLGLDPTTSFPWRTVSQSAQGSGWEIGAFVFVQYISLAPPTSLSVTVQ